MVGLDLKFRVSLVSIKEFRDYYYGENEQGHRRRNPHRRVFRLYDGNGLDLPRRGRSHPNLWHDGGRPHSMNGNRFAREQRASHASVLSHK
jgi:hypothetical protein